MWNRLTRRTALAPAVVASLIAVLAASPGAPAAIGPDSFGYVAAEVSSGFEDISATGTRVLDNHDDHIAPLPLPFAFRFYGTPHDVVFASTNGLLSFGGATIAPVNQPLTAPISPNLALVAVLWDDWLTFASADDAVHHETLGTPGTQRFIVQWHVVQHYPASPSTVTFQAVLYEEDGALEYRYLDAGTQDAAAGGASATVGIRDVAGDENGRSLEWSHNEAVIADGSAIRFTTNRAPDCAGALSSSAVLWPPNHKLREVGILGAADPDGDQVTVTILGVTQDEPLGGSDAARPAPDAVIGEQQDQVALRAERAGAGDGRVYTIAFSATDGRGATCTGATTVGVPRSPSAGAAVDSTPPSYDSFGSA
jgi:hypothetical protein